MHFAELNGVFFIEGRPVECRVIGPVSVELNGAFSQAQLKSLDDVKIELARLVSSKGGNCVADFKYGQRSTFWGSLWGMDKVAWYGSGTIGSIAPSELAKYRKP